jgi:hypothetical protein
MDSTLGQNVYGGLAQVGQLKATIGVVVAVCIASSFCASGGLMINAAATDKHTGSASAVLSQVNCNSNACTAVGTYNVDGKSYTTNVTTMNPAPSNVNISYNPSNPGDGVQNKPSTGFGIGLIVVGFIVVLIGAVVYWVTMSYKPIAALQGAGAIYDVGKAVF